MSKTAIVVGGAGALGKSLVKHLVKYGFNPLSIDFTNNNDTTQNLLLNPNQSLAVQYAEISDRLKSSLSGKNVSGVFCAAGGWMGGSIAESNFLEVISKMHSMNLEPAALAANISSNHLDNNGILVLTGASAALNPVPFMIGYGNVGSIL